MLNFLKRIISSLRAKRWGLIDEMPLYNWVKCNDGKLIYIRKKAVGVVNRRDLEAFTTIYDEYLSEFGLNDRYKRYLEAKRKKAIYQAKYVIKKDRFLLNKIEIEDGKIKDLERFFGDGQRIESVLTYISMWCGYKIDQKTTSVKEYFTLLEEYGKANKKK